MFLTRWLQRTETSRPAHRDRRPPRRRQSPCRRQTTPLLQVEQLEHRWCPSYSLVTSRSALAGTDSVNWGTLGPSATAAPNPFTILSTSGRSISVSKTQVDVFVLDEQTPPTSSSSWNGNFAPGDVVLYTHDYSSRTFNPITLNFDTTAVAAGGAQIQSESFGAFTAEVQALDSSGNILASFTENGNSTNAADNSAIFIGISSTSANIYKIALSLTKAHGGSKGDFGINKFDFRTSPLAAPAVAASRAQSSATSADAGDSLYIGDGNDNTVKRFDATTGAYEGTFVTAGSGGLLGPRGLIFGRHGDLVVVNQNAGTMIHGEVFLYDGHNGAFLDKIVATTDPHAPYQPRGIVQGPHHTLFAADLGNLDGIIPGRLAQYDDTTGAWLGDLQPTGFTGEFNPRSLVVGPDGVLYVSVRNVAATGGHILKFSPGTGAFLGDFVDSNATNDLNRPEGLVFGPDGNLYITSFRADASDTDKILEFNGKTGAYLGKIDLDQVGGDRAFAQALLFGPGGKLFVPITGNGPDTGEVRRYDVSTGTFDVFVPPNASGGPLGMPWYLTFGSNDPATLDYDGADRSATASAAVAPTTHEARLAPDLSWLVPSLLRTGPATPLPAPAASTAHAAIQNHSLPTPDTITAIHPGPAELVFAAAGAAANDDSAWLAAAWSSTGLDGM
jgi:hypothetical protein